MSASYMRKYGTGTGADIYINIPKAGSANHAVSADWTPAAGDVKISKDGGAAANIGTLPTAIAMGNSTIWKFVFSDAELQAAFISVTVSDSATKAVDDTGFSIETYGNASALHAFDLDTATQSVSVTQWSGTNVAAVDTAGYPKVTIKAGSGTGEVSLSSGAVTVGTNNDKTGYSIGAGGIAAAAFAAGAIDASAIAADAIGSSELAASAVTEIAAGVAAAVLATPANLLATDASGRVDLGAIEGATDSATRFTRALKSTVTGTVGAASSTTSVVSSALSPSGTAADQFKGRIMVFDKDTTTAALRGQATDITASSAAATPTFTVTALTTAPASGDTFTIQ